MINIVTVNKGWRFDLRNRICHGKIVFLSLSWMTCSDQIYYTFIICFLLSQVYFALLDESIEFWIFKCKAKYLNIWTYNSLNKCLKVFVLPLLLNWSCTDIMQQCYFLKLPSRCGLNSGARFCCQKLLTIHTFSSQTEEKITTVLPWAAFCSQTTKRQTTGPLNYISITE